MQRGQQLVTPLNFRIAIAIGGVFVGVAGVEKYQAVPMAWLGWDCLRDDATVEAVQVEGLVSVLGAPVR
jgi:hypothetical protein